MKNSSNWRGFVFAATICLFPGPRSLATAQQFDARNATVADLWTHVLATNRIWLEPEPNHLSYVVTCIPAESEERLTKTVNRVSLATDQARWEMEVQRPNEDEILMSYVLVVDGDGEQYLKSPREELVGVSRPARNIHPLRQGITWRTSLHILAEQGLPGETEIVERREVNGGHVLVFECDLGKNRCDVGIGLYHSFKGQARFNAETVRVHVKTPEFIPLKEEFLSHNVTIEYSPEFISFGEQRAPHTIRHVSTLFTDGTPWILEAQFQAIDNVWLLRKAFNIQHGKPIVEMVVKDASTAAVDKALFAIPDALD